MILKTHTHTYAHAHAHTCKQLRWCSCVLHTCAPFSGVGGSLFLLPHAMCALWAPREQAPASVASSLLSLQCSTPLAEQSRTYWWTFGLFPVFCHFEIAAVNRLASFLFVLVYLGWFSTKGKFIWFLMMHHVFIIIFKRFWNFGLYFSLDPSILKRANPHFELVSSVTASSGVFR